MTSIDWVIVVVVALSVGGGVWRGFIREVFALAGWIAAFVCAALFGGVFASVLPAAWSEITRNVIGHVAVFVLVLLIAGLAGWVLSRIVRAAGLGAVDRLFGGVFGAARGILIICAFVIVASLTTLSRGAAWKDSVLLPPVIALLHGMRPWLPEGTGRVLQASAAALSGVLHADHRSAVEGVEICAGSSAS